MKIRKIDDYQSWAVEIGERRMLIDPWLTDELSLPAHWFYGRRREAPKVSSWPCDALLLTAPFADHLHPKTLATIAKDTPVFTHKVAARTLRKLGFVNVTAMTDGMRVEPWPGFTMEAVAPAMPYAHNALGLIFEHGGARAYMEPHIIHLERAKQRVGNVDLVIAPVQSVRVAGVPFAMSAERALEAAKVLNAPRWAPTGIDAHLAHGFFSATLIFYRGVVNDFRELVTKAGLVTKVVEPGAGDVIEL